MAGARQRRDVQVPDIIKKQLRDQLGAVRIISVNVEEENDPDGDPVLHVIVVYETEDRELDPSRLSGLLRHLRPALSEHGEDRFPVMSFIDREDYAATA